MVNIEIHNNDDHDNENEDEIPPTLGAESFSQMMNNDDTDENGGNDEKLENDENDEPRNQPRNDPRKEQKEEQKEERKSSRHIYCILHAESKALQNDTIDKCILLVSHSKITFCTRWRRIAYAGPVHSLLYLPTESFSELLLTIGSTCCSENGTSVFVFMNINTKNQNQMISQLVHLCETDVSIKQTRTFGALQTIEIYNKTKPMSHHHQLVYHLLTELSWSAQHRFHACTLDKTNPDVYGIEIPNATFVLHHIDAYKRWQGIREQLESRDSHAFLFWLHRLFFFSIPFL